MKRTLLIPAVLALAACSTQAVGTPLPTVAPTEPPAPLVTASPAPAATSTPIPTPSASPRPSPTPTVTHLAVHLPPKPKPAPRVDVFYSPHQDDETLSMGSLIIADVARGDIVYIDLITDGSGSGVCPLDYPTLAACTAGRDAEFMAATHDLGIPASHVRMWGFQDAHLTQAQAASAIAFEVAKHPGATHTTMSPDDNNPDHAALGRALLAQAGIAKTWTVGWPYWARHGTHNCSWVVAPHSKLVAALNDYRPFGWQSVGHWFQEVWAKGTDLVCR